MASALSILVHLSFFIAVLPWLPGLTRWNIAGDAGVRLEVELASEPGATASARDVPAPPAPRPDARTSASAPPPPANRDAPPPPANRDAPPPLLAVPAARAPAIPQPAAPGKARATSPTAAPPMPSTTPPAPADAPTPAVAAPAPAAVPLHAPVDAIESARALSSIGGDLSSYIAARRRARDAQSVVADAEAGRQSRLIPSEMPALRSPIADPLRRRGGGVFEVTRITRDDGEFLFFGWNSDGDRRQRQAYEVRLGNDGDMRIAIVRRMIALIREHERGDFRWQSWRLGRIVVLSARLGDDAALEEFMLHEFFDDSVAAIRR